MNAIQIIGFGVAFFGAVHALANLIRAHRIYEAQFARMSDDEITRQLADCEAPSPAGFYDFHDASSNRKG